MSKQITRVNDGMNTLEIEACLRSDPKTSPIFRGVFAADRLPLRAHYPSLYCVNTMAHHHPGEHWVILFFSRDKCVEYFDSLGRAPRPPWHTEFMKRNARQHLYSRFRVQSLTSNYCGQYCIMYAMNRARGKSMSAFLNRFSKRDYIANDALVARTFAHNFPSWEIRSPNDSR